MAKALIVEDQDDIMPAIEDALAGRGDTFNRASSLDEARAMFQADDYAYVLLDLKIPSRIGGAFPDKIYGLKVLKEIRQTAGKGHTPVIAMTSFHSDGFGISTELHAWGVNECISKPFDENRPLMTVIEDVLAAATARDRASADDPSDGAVSVGDGSTDRYRLARQVDLVRATNQVLAGEVSLSPGTLSKAVKAGEIEFNGQSGRPCRVDVDSFLAWIKRKGGLANDEVKQIHNAIIGEINSRKE